MEIKIPPTGPEKLNLEVSQKLICMAKVRNLAEIAPNIGFTEFDFYDLYRAMFEKSGLGRIKKLLPLREMSENFGLVRKSLKPKPGHRSYFTPEGKVALMFLKMCAGLNCPKLMEQLNGNIHYQIFCDVIIDPARPLTNYKLLDDIMMELARVRAASMEGSLGTQKEHYDLKRVKARTKLTEILYIFFGVDTANLVQLEKKIELRARVADT